MSKDITFEPPRCPECGANLFRVLVDETITATWNAQKGVYEEDGELKMRCPDCRADLYDVFPDGVCNYVHPSKNQE